MSESICSCGHPWEMHDTKGLDYFCEGDGCDCPAYDDVPAATDQIKPKESLMAVLTELQRVVGEAEIMTDKVLGQTYVAINQLFEVALGEADHYRKNELCSYCMQRQYSCNCAGAIETYLIEARIRWYSNEVKGKE